MADARGEVQRGWGDVGEGLRASFSKGDYKGIGTRIGGGIVGGISSQFGMLGNVAGSIATALGPIGVVALGIGAAVAVAGMGISSCVSEAASWETQMVGVKKVVGDISEADFSRLSSDLMAIRAETGMSSEDITGAAAGAGRMGIDPSEIAEYTQVILQMADAWEVPAESASNAIGKMGSVVKPAEMAWADFARSAGSAINDLADSMATSEASIVTGVSKLGGSMAMLKPSPDQISGWYALVAQLQAFGMTAETSGESVKDAISYMMRDTGDIAGLLDMDTSEFQSALREDAIGTIQELAVAISELPIEEQGAALAHFGATGGQALGMLAGKVDPITGEIDGLSAALATADEAWASGSSLADSYAEKQNTLNAQMDIFGGKVDVVQMKIGGALLPVFTDWMKTINETTDSLVDLGTRGWGAITGIDEKMGPLGIDELYGYAKDPFSAVENVASWGMGKLGDWFGIGEELGEDLAAGVGEGTEGLGEQTAEELANSDAKKAAEESGEGLGEAAGTGYRNAWNEEMQRWADFHEQSWSKFSRSGTLDVNGELLEARYTADRTLNWDLYVNGESVTTTTSPSYFWDAYVAKYPALAAITDPKEFQAMIEESRGNKALAGEIRAEIVLDAKLEASESIMRDALVAKNEAVREMAEEAAAAYQEAFDDAMGEGIILDWGAAWADLGKSAIDAFADNLISGAEVLDMIDLYDALEIADPAKFAEMGGEAGRALWQGLYDALEARADYIAGLPVGVEADPAKLKEMQDDIVAAAEAVQPLKIAAEMEILPPDLSELGRALWWEDIGYDMKEELGEYADDLEMLSEAVDNATEHQGLLAEAFDVVTDQAGHQKETIDLATNALKQYTDVPDEAIDRIRAVFAADEIGAATDSMRNYGETIDAVNNGMSNFARFQEDAANKMFQPSFIGSEGYLEFDTLRDLTQQAHTLEFAIAAQGLDPDSPEAKALAAEYFETKQLALTIGVEVPANQAWIDALYDTGEEEGAGKSISIPVQLETTEAYSALEIVRADIAAPITIPVDIDLTASIDGLYDTISGMIWDAIGENDRATTRG